MAATYVGDKAAKEDADDNDKRRKYSPLERCVSVEVEEKKAGNGQCEPDDNERAEKNFTVGNTRLG